jgi:hypothetical protein
MVRERSNAEKMAEAEPVDHDEVYKEIFEQAENFKKYQRMC